MAATPPAAGATARHPVPRLRDEEPAVPEERRRGLVGGAPDRGRGRAHWTGSPVRWDNSMTRKGLQSALPLVCRKIAPGVARLAPLAGGAQGVPRPPRGATRTARS